MDKVSEGRLKPLNPILAAKVRELSNILEAENIKFRIVQGLRTFADQQKLYEQGRTTPGAIVTNAKGGESWHNFGLAVDVVPMHGAIPAWDDKAAYERIIAVGESLGMVSGKSWKDSPHLQLTGRFGVSPDDEVRALLVTDGVEGVWKEAGLVLPADV